MGDHQHAAAPLVRVELFEDRASVIRRVDLPRPGRHSLRLGPFTPLLSARGLTLRPSSGVEVEETHLEREALTRDQAEPEWMRDLRQRVEALEDQVRARTDEATRARDAAALAAATAEAGWAWSSRALLEEEDPVAWARALQSLEASRSGSGLEAARLQRELKHQVAELKHWQGLLKQARREVVQHRVWLHLDVAVTTPGSLELRYTVPCALWRPIHRASLSQGRIRWELRAMVWNATGEAWEAPLVCSTERPGDDPEPPELSDDYLQARSRSSQITVEARDEITQVARQGQARQASALPGVDDGGEVRTYTTDQPATVPTDGRPVSVGLATWESEAQVGWEAHPELSSAVVRVSRQHNLGQAPLLAGPVELVFQDQAAGRASVGFVGPGEPFRLGWGASEDVRLSRTTEVEQDTGRITGHQHLTHLVKLRLVHLGDSPVSVQVKERVPVSELKEVEVAKVQLSPAGEGPDADGFCTWRVELRPGKHKELELRYELSAPARVDLSGLS